MVYTKPLAAIAALSLLAPRAAAFDAQSKANVAVYYVRGESFDGKSGHQC